MASFPLADIGKVVAHPAKGMTWSKGVIIVKRLAYPKGVTPAHLKGYTEKFTVAAKSCAVEPAVRDQKGAARVQAMNACVAAELKR